MIEIVLVGGYGRMGKAIQEVIDTKQYPVHLSALVVEKRIEKSEIPLYTSIKEALEIVTHSSCVVIDFSSPQSTLNILPTVSECGIPLVIGTTGFTKEEQSVITSYASKIPILLSSNMSRGITALLRILPSLIKYLGEEYNPEIVEVHHKHKKDAPSGTALRLSKSICDAKGWGENAQCYHREGLIGERPQEEIGIQTLRGGGAIGKHSVFLLGEDEEIEITHTAYSRRAFARGAIQSALWIHGKPASLYSMVDVE